VNVQVPLPLFVYTPLIEVADPAGVNVPVIPVATLHPDSWIGGRLFPSIPDSGLVVVALVGEPRTVVVVITGDVKLVGTIAPLLADPGVDNIPPFDTRPVEVTVDGIT
jgi:hypothetical protein